MASSDSDPIKYEQQVYASGLHSSKPPFTFQTSEWETLAKPVLSGSAWGYIHGNAGTGSTYAKNVDSFSKYSIIPNRLVPSLKDSKGNELFSDCSTTVLGEKLKFPIAAAPVGVQKIFNSAGETAASKAAASIGIPYILSTASSTSIEDVAKANGEGGQRWFQLYWPTRENDDITISLLNRAKKAGYTALFVTLDTFVLGWRPSDME